MLNLQPQVLHHDSSKKLFGDVLELARQLIHGLINDAEKEARHSIDQAKYETLTFIDALRNVAFAIFLQTSNLTLSFVNEIQRKAEEYETSVIEMVDSLHTLPRITQFTVHEALFGGATIFHDPASFVDILLTVLDALVLSSFWLIFLMLFRRDFIHLFFGIISSLFSLHFLSRFTNLLIYTSYGWNSNISLYMTFVLSRTTILFLSIGSMALHLIALVTHLNRRPPKFLDLKIYLPLVVLCLSLSIFSISEAPLRFWYWINFSIELLSLGISMNLLFFIFILCPCKHAKYSRFEKNVAVKDAKSNLIGVLIFYCFITLPFIVLDIGTNLGVAALTTFTEETQCLLHKVPNLSFPCGKLYFLVDTSFIIRPIFLLLPAYIILPSSRKNPPWKVWKEAKNPPVEPPREEILKKRRKSERLPSTYTAFSE